MFAVKLKSLLHHDPLRITDVCRGVIRSNLVKSGREKGVAYRCFTSVVNSNQKPAILTVRNGELVRRQIKTTKQKPRSSPITWKSFLITFGIGSIFVGYVMYLKSKKLEAREKERKRALGKARIGGRFDLVDQDNNPVKSEDFFGQWLLVYFGFTHCPDICPDEIEKMVEVINTIEKAGNTEPVKPIFITVDPERDSPPIVKKYLKEFSDKIVGLTGTVEQIAGVCKAFRVYFSPGPKDSDADYIVDHSIIMYLIDPEGNFIDYYGQNSNAFQIASSIQFNQVKYTKGKSKSLTSRFQEILFS